VSKNFKNANINSEEKRFFPFLNSRLFDASSQKKLSFDKIDAICDSKRILKFVLQRPPCNSFIFFGRSNIGKSSLINKLIGVPVNETSKQPGKTKELVFLRLNTVQRTYFVDAPGYGYASAASK
jgi:GTP-binding protein EngB required for normal cell division